MVTAGVEKPVNATAPDTGATDTARLWLHGTDDDGVAVLSVLERHLAVMPAPPECKVTGPGANGLPGATNDARALHVFAQRNRPSALVLAGDRLPRAMIECARNLALGLFLVDVDRPREAGRWRLWHGMETRRLKGFSEIHCRDQQAAESLAPRIGKGTVLKVSGPMARFPPAPPCNRAELQAMGALLSGRPVWFAQQVPLPEARHVLLAHTHALRQWHRLLLIVSPDHHRRGPAIADVATDIGLVHARRSLDQNIGETTQIYIADTGEDPGLFLRLANVCYLGGSSTDGADTPSPLPAISLGAVPVFGPAARLPFLERLARAGAGHRISSGAALGDVIGAVLQPEAVAAAAVRGWDMVTQGNDATDRVANALMAWLRQAPPTEGGS